MTLRGMVPRVGLMVLLFFTCLSVASAQSSSSSGKKMTNTYEGTLKLPNGGLEKVRVEASSWNHAKQMLEMKYGKGNVQNVHQTR